MSDKNKIDVHGIGIINIKRMSTGNAKIKNTLIFNMPAGKTGTCNQDCKGCYAKKAERLYPRVKSQREQNLDLFNTQPDLLKVLLVDQIQESKIQVIRIHEAGDFFSSQYFEFWEDIIDMFPSKKFYAYTKSRFPYSLPNFNLIDSYIHKVSGDCVNYGDLNYCLDLQAYGYFICPTAFNKDIKCNEHCFYCHNHSKVVFLKH